MKLKYFLFLLLVLVPSSFTSRLRSKGVSRRSRFVERILDEDEVYKDSKVENEPKEPKEPKENQEETDNQVKQPDRDVQSNDSKSGKVAKETKESSPSEWEGISYQGEMLYQTFSPTMQPTTQPIIQPKIQPTFSPTEVVQSENHFQQVTKPWYLEEPELVKNDNYVPPIGGNLANLIVTCMGDCTEDCAVYSKNPDYFDGVLDIKYRCLRNCMSGKHDICSNLRLCLIYKC